MTTIYRFADIAVQITAVYPAVHDLCSGYVYSGSADFAVVTAREDIEFEREKSAEEDRAEGIPVRQFSDEYLETLAVYRQISEKMPICTKLWI